MTRNWEKIKEYSDIYFELCDGVAKITINRPEVYNAFRPQTVNDMLDAMDIARERQDINVVVLTGIGDKAFCSGGDKNVKRCRWIRGRQWYSTFKRIRPPQKNT